jgi:hypothetical protein
MGPLDRITDRCLGYLGLFLIGAISWAADRLGPANRLPGVPTRVVHRTLAPARAAARPGSSIPRTLRAGG